MIRIIKHLNTFTDEKGKVIIKPTRLDTIKSRYEPYLKIYNQNSKSESFANWYYEKRLLGYTYEKSLKDIFAEKRENLLTLTDVLEMPINTKVAFVAEVKEFYSGVSKNEKKTKYVRMKVSDETANLTVLMFNDKIDNNKLLNNNKNFDENNVVIFKGIKKDDCVFVDLAAIQDHQIYMKLSEIKNIAKNI